MIDKDKENYIKKGKIELIMDKDFNSNYPQAALQTLFWIRMSCYENNSFPSNENILLIGNTSYKETILKNWLDSINKIPEVYYLTKNTEIQNLIGMSSLDDEEKIDEIINQIEKDFKDNYNKNLDDKNIDKIFEKEDINIRSSKVFTY